MAEKDRGLSFGIAYLDNITLGSMRPGSMGLLMGPAGTGKSALASHFLFNGAAAGENVCLITNEPPARVTEHLSRFKTYEPGWTKDGYLTVFDLEDLSSSIGISTERPTRDELGLLYDLLADLLDQLDISRIALDPANPLLKQIDSTGMPSFLRDMKGKLIDRGTCALLTYDTYRPISDWDLECLQPDMLDVFIRFSKERGAALNMNTLSIERFKGSPHSKKTYVVDISPEGVTLVPRIELPEVR